LDRKYRDVCIRFLNFILPGDRDRRFLDLPAIADPRAFAFSNVVFFIAVIGERTFWRSLRLNVAVVMAVASAAYRQSKFLIGLPRTCNHFVLNYSPMAKAFEQHYGIFAVNVPHQFYVRCQWSLIAMRWIRTWPWPIYTNESAHA